MIKENSPKNIESNCSINKKDSIKKEIYNNLIQKCNYNLKINKNQTQSVKLSKLIENKAWCRSKEIVAKENETFRTELNEILNINNFNLKDRLNSSFNTKTKLANPQFFLQKKSQYDASLDCLKNNNYHPYKEKLTKTNSHTIGATEMYLDKRRSSHECNQISSKNKLSRTNVINNPNY